VHPGEDELHVAVHDEVPRRGEEVTLLLGSPRTEVFSPG
jgi:hypothetical protein